MRDRGIRRTAAIAAIATFVLHVAANPHYGFFRDELYFIICGFRPAWGYVDQPPVVPLLSAASQLFGHSLVLLRALPAAFAAGGVYVTCLLAGELGGGIFAAVLATLAFLAAPVLESFGMKVSPDMAGLWLWPLVALYVLRIVKGADPRWWLAAGACVGVALESKYSVIFFAIALVLGLALTPQRRAMRTPWFLAGAAVAVALAIPNFVWQALHGFPMWELLQNGAHGKNVIAPWRLFLLQQLLLTNLFVAPIWIAGLIRLTLRKRRPLFGLCLRAADCDDDRLACEALLSRKRLSGLDGGRRSRLRRLHRARAIRAPAARCRDGRRRALLSAVFAAAARRAGDARLFRLRLERAGNRSIDDGDRAHAQFRPTRRFRRYARLAAARAERRGDLRCVAAGKRAQAAIVASNYGEAAAIDFFGGRYGLPPALSGHNNYWLWGWRNYSGNVVIDVNGDCGRTDFPGLFRRLAARHPFQPAVGNLVRTEHSDIAVRRDHPTALEHLAKTPPLHLASPLRAGLYPTLLQSQVTKWSLTIPTACMKA